MKNRTMKFVKNMCRTVVRTVAMEEKAEMSFS